MARIAFALVAATLLASALPVAAGEIYRGAFYDRGRPVPVILTVGPYPIPGAAAGQIRFGEPWVCGFDLEFSGASGPVETYSFRGPAGGLCRALALGYLRSQAGGNYLQVELFDRANVSRYTFTLGLAR